MSAEQFLGMSKKSAQDKAEKLNMIFYLVRKDQEFYLPYPTDKRADRICVEIENGKVVQCVIQ